MPKFALIGNAPSSGSTFLADLLDSTPHSVCGPELDIFSNRFLYDWGRFQRKPWKTSNTYQVCVTGIFPRQDHLADYGLDPAGFEKLVRASDSPADFMEKFAGHFWEHRQRKGPGIVFEKTPQNLNCIGEYLASNPDGYFITIVRNPLFVYPSLLKRGFGPYTALVTWLVDIARYWDYRDHPRVITLHYEELTQRPFEIVADVLRQIDPEFSSTPEEIQEGYENNPYRSGTSKIKSWTISDYGGVHDANRKEISPEVLKAFGASISMRVALTYAKLNNLPELSFMQAIRGLHYQNGVLARLRPVEADRARSVSKNNADLKKLTSKWLRTYRSGEASFGDLKAILNPVIWS